MNLKFEPVIFCCYDVSMWNGKWFTSSCENFAVSYVKLLKVMLATQIEMIKLWVQKHSLASASYSKRACTVQFVLLSLRGPFLEYSIICCYCCFPRWWAGEPWTIAIIASCEAMKLPIFWFLEKCQSDNFVITERKHN